MSVYLKETKDISCECCGFKILNGDLIYDTGDGVIHEECFYDYLRTFVAELGWRHYVYGDEEI